MSQLGMIRKAQETRLAQVEEPSLTEVRKMISDIGYLLSTIDALTLQVETLQHRLSIYEGNPYTHYSAVEDLGG